MAETAQEVNEESVKSFQSSPRCFCFKIKALKGTGYTFPVSCYPMAHANDLILKEGYVSTIERKGK